MELREWLIILGLALVSLIVVDGVRRLQRQRRVPRLDQAVDNLPKASVEELDDEAKEAEINWELPNGGARVVKPADYSGLGKKPQLERQEHPGPSRVLSDFKRSFSRATGRGKPAADGQRLAFEGGFNDARSSASSASAFTASNPAVSRPVEPAPRASVKSEKPPVEKTPVEERREPSLFAEPVPAAAKPQPAASIEPTEQPAPVEERIPAPAEPIEPTLSAESDAASESASLQETSGVKVDATEAPPAAEEASAKADSEVLRAEPEDAGFTKTESRKRRQLRSHTAGELDDEAVDAYRLVDFEGMGRSFKRRMIERRETRARKKIEKAERAKALAKQKAERKALEAEQRREAKEAAEAEKARIAQENARAREIEAAHTAPRFQNDELYSAEPSMSALRRHSAERFDLADEGERTDEPEAYFDDAYGASSEDESVVRAHPTLEKALRHDVSGARAKEALTDASEMIVISVLSRDEEGFEGGKLLELMMACGLRYCSAMGVFHRFETESDDSGLQFSMVNVVKPGTFPIEQMDEFTTPGVTLLMPLPGALDASAAFEAMVETAMVVVRHMGGELKDENRSVMTAQTIEFARQRVHEFERRHRLQRHAR
ncbi:cell division protein ZipA [Halomonas sp. HNIBRBA4712]|uniref:cell division protein ZipA n=1 Tax=Halomonas sp. HNIBRBA4712 TaxID=3373087 RepID=UPI0037468042